MISFEDSLVIHGVLIEQFGGADGIRDESALKAALSRPHTTFDGKDLYPTAVDKAAAILQSILINHPFIDGNKRVGYVFMRLMLMNEGFDIQASEDEKYQFVIETAEGKLDIDKITSWIKKHIY